MRVQEDQNQNEESDSKRLTSFGKALRASSIDELPSLWNITKGEMSFIGPRPLFPEYLELYSQRQRKRHSVKPGLTGLAQISGRNLVPWDERFELDVQYTEQLSISLDIKILLKTFRIIIRQIGISEAGSSTMTKFGKGNSD